MPSPDIGSPTPPASAGAAGQGGTGASGRPDPSGQPRTSGQPDAFGRYQVVGRLGRGGQGVVYRAVDEDGTVVAVKALHVDWAWDARLRERFAREVDAARRVASFCTAGILDADLTAQPPYLVSEYVPGPSLRQQITERGPRTAGELHRLAVGTVTALAAIHRAGVVHRDFKPDNVLLGPDGPRVIDFGVAHTGTGASLTEGETIGTPAYMAPEQADAGVVGTAADMFSWAEVMIYAATGTPPFGDDTPMAVVARLFSDEPDTSALDEPLRGLCERCLCRDPASRPAAREVLLGLLGGATDDAGTAPETGSQARVPVQDRAARSHRTARSHRAAATDPRGDARSTVVPNRSAHRAAHWAAYRAAYWAAYRAAYRGLGRHRPLAAVAAGVVLLVAAGVLGWRTFDGDRPAAATGAGHESSPASLSGTWHGVAHVPQGFVSAVSLRLTRGGSRGRLTDASRKCATGLRRRGTGRYALTRVGAMRTCLPGRRVSVRRRAAGGVVLDWSGGHATLRPARAATPIPAAFRGSWVGTERVTDLHIHLTLPRDGTPKWRAAALDCTAAMRPWARTDRRLVLVLQASPQCGGDDLIELTVDGTGLRYRSTFRTGTTQRAELTHGA